MLVDGQLCTRCNAIVPSSANFCGICGQKLNKSIWPPFDFGNAAATMVTTLMPGQDQMHERATTSIAFVAERKAKPSHASLWPPTRAQFVVPPSNALSLVSRLSDIAGVALPLFAILLWSLSLRFVNVRHMTDLGLVSVLPASIIAALIILTLSFCMVLNRQKQRVPVILFHLALLIFMLYGITTLVEQAPRFAIVYRHAGYTDYIMRTGTVNPALDAYFNWPGFFILSAFLTQIAGYHDILSYAAWAPVFFNLIYLPPMYVIFTTAPGPVNRAPTDKRIVWLALWFFYVTNWIAQDYFSPQGLNFFLYLVIIAILLKWFKKPAPARQNARLWRWPGRLSSLVSRVYDWLTAPDPPQTPASPWQRRALLAAVVVIFTFMVFSHPLTPFFSIGSVAALVIFGRCTPRWLPILMCIITAAWLIFMTQAYLTGHLGALLAEVGQLGGSVSANVTSRVSQGDPDHTLVGEIRLIMTLLVWSLAFAGAVRRLRKGYRDASYVLLAVAPFPILLIQGYGGEMLLRIYLFTLPPMVFFAAALFYTVPAPGRPLQSLLPYTKSPLTAEYGRGDPCGRPGAVSPYGRNNPCGRPGTVSPSSHPRPCTSRAEVVWGYRRAITKVAPIAGQQLARLRRHALRQHILHKVSIRLVPTDGRPQWTLLPQSEKPEEAIPDGRPSTARPLRVAFMKVAIVVICLVLLVGFLFTRYGNENMDYMTNAEVTGVRYLYTIAPRGSLLIAGWNGTPWEFQNYEQYDHEVLAEDVPGAVVTRNVASIVQLVQSIDAPATYVIFTRSQKVTARMDGLPPGILDRLGAALLASGKFTQIYSNTDAQIFMYIHVPVRTVPKQNK